MIPAFVDDRPISCERGGEREGRGRKKEKRKREIKVYRQVERDERGIGRHNENFKVEIDGEKHQLWAQK